MVGGGHPLGAIGDVSGRKWGVEEYNWMALGLSADGHKYSGIQPNKWKYLNQVEKKSAENDEEIREEDEQCNKTLQSMKFGNNGSLNLIASQNRGYNSSQKRTYDRPYIFFVKVTDGRKEKFLFPMKYAKTFYNLLGNIISMNSEQVTFIDEENEFM